jgi:hypothetical protein
MRWFGRRSSDPPEGVRLVRPGLGTVDCDVLRDPGMDENGCAAWIAVPQSGERLAYRPGVDYLTVAVLPGKTVIHLDLDVDVAL